MHNYATKIKNPEKRRVQLQDTGDAVAIKETNNLKQSERERRLSQNFRVTIGQKPTIDTHTNKSNQLKYNAKGSHQSTKGENKRRREEKRATATNPKQLMKWQ